MIKFIKLFGQYILNKITNVIFYHIIKRHCKLINLDSYISIKSITNNLKFSINSLYLNYFNGISLHNLSFNYYYSYVLGNISINKVILYLGSTLELNLSSQYSNTFELWNNHYHSIIDDLYTINNLLNEFIYNNTLFIKHSIIHYRNHLINITNFRAILSIKDNTHYIRINIGKIKITHYVILNDIHFSIKNGTISSIMISSINIKINRKFLETLLDIYNSLNIIFSEGQTICPNIYCNNIHITFENETTILFKLHSVCLEKFIARIDSIILKSWKKDMLWIDKLSFNIKQETGSINNIRCKFYDSFPHKLQLISKLWKTFDLYKLSTTTNDTNYNNLYRTKIYTTLFDIQKSYIRLLDSIYSENVNNIINDFEINVINEYLQSTDIIPTLKINNVKIELFKNKKQEGYFSFNQFKFIFNDNKTSIYANKFIVAKKDFIYIDIPDTLCIVLEEEHINLELTMIILKLQIDEISLVFSTFSKHLISILDAFSFSKNKHNNHIDIKKNYVFKLFSISSLRICFSYYPSKLNISNIIEGHFLELLNAINYTDFRFILKNIDIQYPKDYTNIVEIVINKWLSDLLHYNNTISILTNSDNLQKIIRNIPKTGQTICNIVNNAFIFR